jgi:Zn-dependent protease/predicted transcriptional regulator
MFGKRIPLFKLFGFRVSIDVSWFILAVLIIWTLSDSVFPSYFEGFSKVAYLWMGITGALGLFASIIFHEFCHSLVARRYGLPMRGITLFIFGGVAEMLEEPKSPKAEFLMAIAGPVSSVLLATGLYLIRMVGAWLAWPAPINNVLYYLVLLNFVLAVFNLLPAFPLDGGRVLRSILWAVRGNLRWATKIASQLGSGFGLFLIIMGVLRIVMGYGFVGGVWSALIGMFIRNASAMSYKQLLVRSTLGGEEIWRFMKTDIITVLPSISIGQLVNDYFYRYHFKMFPVCDGDLLLGCISTEQVKQVPREQWDDIAVGDIVKLCSAENTISPQASAVKALSIMKRTGNSLLMVVDAGRLVGIVTLKDMLKFLDLKIDLEGK